MPTLRKDFMPNWIAYTDDGTEELSAPPVLEEFVSGIEVITSKKTAICAPSGCDNKVRISDEGNHKYAWLYANNSSDETAIVLFEQRWTYKGERRSRKVRRTVPAKDRREIFSFPRRQDPELCILECDLSN